MPIYNHSFLGVSTVLIICLFNEYSEEKKNIIFPKLHRKKIHRREIYLSGFVDIIAASDASNKYCIWQHSPRQLLLHQMSSPPSNWIFPCHPDTSQGRSFCLCLFLCLCLDFIIYSLTIIDQQAHISITSHILKTWIHVSWL